jgi:MFS family permease
MFKLKNSLAVMRSASWYPWLVLLMSCLFLFYKYIAQFSPSVMTNDLMQQFNLHATGLGGLAACYFYSYLVAQLFAGPLLDRYSARYLSFVALLLISLGLFGFAHADHLKAAYFFRLLMGVGAAFATVSYLKLAAVWFSEKLYNLVAGLLATAASFGALTSQTPLAFSVAHYGWRHTLLYAALLGFFVAVLYWFFVRDKSKVNLTDDLQLTPSFNFTGLKQLVKSKKVWFLTVYSGFAWAPLAVFGGLWGNPFLQATYNLTITQASGMVTVAFVGLAFGGPVCGYVASKLNKRLLVMFAGLVLSFFSVTYVVFANSHSLLLLAIALFVFGFGTGAFMLGFAFGKSWFPVSIMASFVALVNTGDGLFTAASEPFVGKLLDYFWQGKIVNGVRIYSVHSYHLAMTTLPVFLLLAMVALFYVKESE